MSQNNLQHIFSVDLEKDHHISGGSSFDELEGGGLTLGCDIFNVEQKLAYAPKKLEE